MLPEELPTNANGHEYVDLGLSVKWATCNVGADSEEWGVAEGVPKGQRTFQQREGHFGDMQTAIPDVLVADTRGASAEENGCWGERDS